MASSGYTAITFVASEQPTTAKWNLIGSNDASFNTGNGFNDNIIIARHVAPDAITPEKLLTGNGTTWVYQNWTPTISNTGGSISATVNYAKYVRIGKTVFFRISINVNSVSAGGGLQFSAPVTGAVNAQYAGGGREDAGTGKLTEVMFKSSTTTLSVFFYDNTGSTASGGYAHVINGHYEAA